MSRPIDPDREAFSRAWSDTTSFLREQVLPTIAFATATGVITYIATGANLGSIVIGVLAAAAAGGMLVFVVYGWNLLWAPHRITTEGAALKNAAMEGELKGLRSNLASFAYAELEIAPQFARGTLALEVTNRGDRAEVEAQVEIVEGHYGLQVHGGFAELPNPYKGYWLGAAGSATILMNGHKDTLLLGGVVARYPTATFEMSFCNQRTNAREIYNTTSWMWPDSKHQTIPAALVLRVTISSLPMMRGGPVIKEYHFRGMDSGSGAEVVEQPHHDSTVTS